MNKIPIYNKIKCSETFSNWESIRGFLEISKSAPCMKYIKYYPVQINL